MAHEIKVRPIDPDDWQSYKNLRLGALADAPDAFGSTLAREQERTDSQWASRLEKGHNRCWNLPLLAEVDGQTAGLAWGRIEKEKPGRADLYQMWVTPGFRKLGVGRMLLDAVILWAKEQEVEFLQLGVTLRDSPAMRLYKRAGFEPAEEPKPLRPGSELMAQPMRLKL